MYRRRRPKVARAGRGELRVGNDERKHRLPTAADGAQATKVDRLLGEGWQPGQIALLVTGKRHQLQKEMLDYHGWDGY